MYGILAETERRGLSFDQLLTIPEQDEWIYSDGKSTTCVAFILAMYKEAGVFGPISNSIQVTEFTVSIFLYPYMILLSLSMITITIWVFSPYFTRLKMHTCSKFMKIIRHAYRSGAIAETISYLSARFLVSIEWNYHTTTLWNHIPT